MNTLSKMMSKKDVSIYSTLSIRHIDRLRDRGEFPQPLKVGRRVMWVTQDIVDFFHGKKGVSS